MGAVSKQKMTFQEIQGNKEAFFENYGLGDAFDKSGYRWDVLMDIARQYDQDRVEKYPELIQKYIAEISKFDAIHSYRYRIKETDSFIKKMITKAAEKGKVVTLDDYRSTITDLLGIRVLYVFKDDYYMVHQQIMGKYRAQMVENVHIKLQKGDDESIYEKILNCDPIIEKNNTYRSIHYTLCAEKNDMDSARLEIQTRTIFEEGWSEINHKLVYKNQDVTNYFVLLQASKILSTLVGNCDNLDTLMRNIYNEYEKKMYDFGNNAVVTKPRSEVMQDILNDFLMS